MFAVQCQIETNSFSRTIICYGHEPLIIICALYFHFCHFQPPPMRPQTVLRCNRRKDLVLRRRRHQQQIQHTVSLFSCYILVIIFFSTTSHFMPHPFVRRCSSSQPPPMRRQAAPRYILHPCPHRSLACLLRAASRRVKALPLALISYLGPPLRAVLCRKIGLGGRLRTDF